MLYTFIVCYICQTVKVYCALAVSLLSPLLTLPKQQQQLSPPHHGTFLAAPPRERCGGGDGCSGGCASDNSAGPAERCCCCDSSSCGSAKESSAASAPRKLGGPAKRRTLRATRSPLPLRQPSQDLCFVGPVLCLARVSQMHSFLQVENTLCVDNVSITMLYNIKDNYGIYCICLVIYLFDITCYIPLFFCYMA